MAAGPEAAGSQSVKLAGAQSVAKDANSGSDPLVAEVDGRAIHLGQVADAIRALPGAQALNSFETLYPAMLGRMIERTGLVVAAYNEGLDKAPRVQRRMQAAMDEVLENEYLHHIIEPSISETALLARYSAQIAGKPGPKERHVWAILLPTEQAATTVISQLADGGEFATIARSSSKDAATARKGGDLGFVQRDNLSPEIGAVAFSMRLGEVDPFPVRTAAGWWVLKADAERQTATPTYAAARERLLAEMMREAVVPTVQRVVRNQIVHVYKLSGDELDPEVPGGTQLTGTSQRH